MKYLKPSLDLDLLKKQLLKYDKEELRKRINDQVLNYAKLLKIEPFSRDWLMAGYPILAFRSHVIVLGAWSEISEYKNVLILQ